MKLFNLRRSCVAISVAWILATMLAGTAHASDGAAAADTAADESAPIKLIVSLDDQRVDVYRGATLVESAPVSTGKRGHTTPTGVYSILQKRKWHRSNIYSAAPMPFMQRITWSGMALHAGKLPGYPASHGCIRLPESFAKKLFSMTEIGADVIVTKNSAKPVVVDHDALFQPALPRLYSEARLETPAAASDGPHAAALFLADLEVDIARMRARTNRSQSPLRILITRRNGRERMIDAQSMLTELGYEPGEVDGYMGPDTGRAIQNFQKDSKLPPTGTFSDDLVAALHKAVGREEIVGHLYVRQDYMDLFDAPVALADPDKPLGTHMYMAADFDNAATKTVWTAVSFDDDGLPDALAALSRISVPENIRTRISELLTPGSSMIISDAGLGRETGKGTDFIVQPR